MEEKYRENRNVFCPLDDSRIAGRAVVCRSTRTRFPAAIAVTVHARARPYAGQPTLFPFPFIYVLNFRSLAIADESTFPLLSSFFFFSCSSSSSSWSCIVFVFLFNCQYSKKVHRQPAWRSTCNFPIPNFLLFCAPTILNFFFFYKFIYLFSFLFFYSCFVSIYLMPACVREGCVCVVSFFITFSLGFFYISPLFYQRFCVCVCVCLASSSTTILPRSHLSLSRSLCWLFLREEVSGQLYSVVLYSRLPLPELRFWRAAINLCFFFFSKEVEEVVACVCV